MQNADHIYIAIDLKSFYASVECVERMLDPLTTCLVVADCSRTDKTICLAVSPGLKSYGVPGRPRLFEVKQKVRHINADRRNKAPLHFFTGHSFHTSDLDNDPSLELEYITAPPRMALYMKYSTDIYKIYLKYIAPEDIHVYSCDEVFIDAAPYLRIYSMSAHDLAMTMIQDVLSSTGITATAGVGTNMFLCKIAMDIVAKHMPADKDGVRIADLDEPAFRKQLWGHTPITDFWSIGSGTARRLASFGLFTMGDIAEYSEIGEDSLFKAFGIKAELIIDHSWGWEPCTMDYIKQYIPEHNSLSTGQVLQRPYDYNEALIIVMEMSDLLSLDLIKKGFITDKLTLTIGYEYLKDRTHISSYKGELYYDWYGRPVPKHAHGTVNLKNRTASYSVISEALIQLYENIVDKNLLIRRVSICAYNIKPEHLIIPHEEYEQLDLFTDYEERNRLKKEAAERQAKEKALQTASLEIKTRFGKNALLKGTNFRSGATTRERNMQIGGHRA